MFDALKRLFSPSSAVATTDPSAPVSWAEVASWAGSRQYGMRAVHDDGFVVDGRLASTPWRLEWGPTQRPYIQGQELRIRAELGLPPELQVVVMNHELTEAMEKAVFEQYVEGVQTRIDNQTPPEMRWLVMFPKLGAADLPAPLRGRCTAVGSGKTWLTQWLEGPLAQALASVRIDPQTPLVLMIGRGRLMLRTELAEPEIGPLQAWLRVFETALREARRVAADSSDESVAPSAAPSTGWGKQHP